MAALALSWSAAVAQAGLPQGRVLQMRAVLSIRDGRAARTPPCVETAALLAQAGTTPTATATPVANGVPLRFTLQIPDRGPQPGCNGIWRDIHGRAWSECHYNLIVLDPEFQVGDAILCSTLAGLTELDMQCACQTAGVLTIFNALPGATVLIQDFGAVPVK